ncbi:MAG TPA: winged helix-turn-helix transcriptional regulator [Candidatus Thermoplasmatota archaeon]
METVAKLDRVIDAFAMLGGDVCVDLCYSDEEDLARRLAAIREQLDAPAPLAFFEYALPSIGRRLVATDWRILASVRRDPSRTLDDVAVELGLSRRTVKRRLAAMQAQGAVDLAYMFNPGRLRGGLMVYLLVGMREASTRTEARAVVNAFKDRWIAQWSPPDARLGHVVLVTTADSAAEVEAQRREAESLGSVAHAQALVLHDAASAPAWIDEEIARRAGAAPTVGRLTVAPEVVRR